MVNTQPRLASIQKISALAFQLILLVWLMGCQTHATKQTAAQAAAHGLPANAFLAPGKKSTLRDAPIPSPIPLKPAGHPAPRSNVPPPAPITQRSLDLPDEISNWRVTRLSAREWRVTPLRRLNLSDSPPSLMEDAIITSGIHARLQAASELRATNWKYSCNSGSVVLGSPELNVDQAVAALEAVIRVDKVSEIRLTTDLH